MKQLLEIRTIPISIEYKVTGARIERVRDRTEMNLDRNRGGLSMRSRSARMNVDTFEAKNSIVPTAGNSVYKSAEQGKKAVYDTIARFAEEGHLLVNDTRGNGEILNQIFEARVADNRQFELTFIPKYPASITWTPPDLEIEYELDKLTFNWQTNTGKFEFKPAEVEFNIKEYPRIVIEYLGGPNYVPPSADPEYEPIDVRG